LLVRQKKRPIGETRGQGTLRMGQPTTDKKTRRCGAGRVAGDFLFSASRRPDRTTERERH
ncbi:MAG: hypothetical protein LW697_01535, partial [Blastopirellula sp.]|nr:hypothetical protein [Blastopirellula sp.]